MNDHKFDFHGRIQVQQNHGLIIPDRNSDFGSRSSSQLFGVQQNLGIWPQQQQQPCTMDQAARLSQLQNLDSPPNKPSSAIMSRFESLASAFFATERYMFPQYDSQVGYNPSLNPHFSSGQPSAAENYSIDATAHQPEPNFEFRASPQPMMIPPDCSTTSVRRQFSVPPKENQDLGVCLNFCNFIYLFFSVFFFLV